MKQETIYVAPVLKEMKIRVKTILCLSGTFNNEDAIDEGELE